MMDVSLEAQRNWPHVGSRYSGKIACPECGATGYIDARADQRSWVWAHREHTTARCGKTVSLKGVRQHEVRCKKCQ